MRNRLILTFAIFFATFGFIGCAKKAVRTGVGVEITKKEMVEEVGVGEGTAGIEAPGMPEVPVVEEAPPAEAAVPEREEITEIPTPERAVPKEVAPGVSRAEPGFGPPEMPAPVTPEAEVPKEAEAVKEAVEFMDVFFDYDRYNIRDDARLALKINARLLRENKNLRITLEGHCDERGTVEYNIALGEKRARAVKRYLSDLGVEPHRMSVISYGKERPFCYEHNEQCWQENRRVHFRLKYYD